MDSIAADERLRYTWYSTFLKSNGVTPKPFDQWVAVYRQKSSGEVDKMAAGEESYEIQRQASNPWNGFWESFFNAAREGQTGDQMVQEPSPDNGVVAPISQPPTGEPEPSVDDAPVEPEVQPESNQLTRTLAALMDEYSENNRTVQEWTEDFDKALRRMALANQIDAAMERHQLVQALGDALDQGILKDQLARMLEERLNPSEFEEPDALEGIDDYKLEPMKFDKDPWGGWGTHDFSVGGVDFTASVDPIEIFDAAYPNRNPSALPEHSSAGEKPGYSPEAAEPFVSPGSSSGQAFLFDTQEYQPIRGDSAVSDYDEEGNYGDENSLGAPRLFMFEDVERGTGITGTGNAPDVFRYVTGLVLSSLNTYKPKYLQFTGAEPSRQKLYRHLAAKVQEYNPNYKAFETYSNGHPTGTFFLVPNSSLDNLSPLDNLSQIIDGFDEDLIPVTATQARQKQSRPQPLKQFSGELQSVVENLSQGVESQPNVFTVDFDRSNIYDNPREAEADLTSRLTSGSDEIPRYIHLGSADEYERRTQQSLASFASNVARRASDYVPLAEKIEYRGEPHHPLSYRLVHKSQLRQHVTEAFDAISNIDNRYGAKIHLFYIQDGNLIPMQGLYSKQQENPEPPEQSEYTIQPTNGKWHPKNRFAKQMYASLMQQFCPEQYGAGTEVDLQSEPDRYPGHEDYAIQPTLFEGASPNSTPKQFDWEPPTEIDPEKHWEAPQIEDPSEPNMKLRDMHWDRRWGLRNKFRDEVASHLIHDDHKRHLMDVMHQSLGHIPRAVIPHIEESSFKLLPTQRSLGEALHAEDRAEAIQNDADLGLEFELANDNPDYDTPAGYYDSFTSTVHLPILHRAPGDEIYHRTHTILHELAHAVDHSFERKHGDRLSSSLSWQNAWRTELSNGDLTSYAKQSPEEAFAEFARYAWTDPAEAERRFPKSYSVFEQHDLIHKHDHQAVVARQQ